MAGSPAPRQAPRSRGPDAPLRSSHFLNGGVPCTPPSSSLAGARCPAPLVALPEWRGALHPPSSLRYARSSPLAPLRSHRLAVRRPAATERAVKLNQRSEFLLPQAREIELALKQISLRIEDRQVAVQTALVSLRRELRRRGERCDEMFLFDALLVCLRVPGETVRHVPKRAVYRALVVDERLAMDGFRQADVVARAPGVEEWHRGPEAGAGQHRRTTE